LIPQQKTNVGGKYKEPEYSQIPKREDKEWDKSGTMDRLKRCGARVGVAGGLEETRRQISCNDRGDIEATERFAKLSDTPPLKTSFQLRRERHHRSQGLKDHPFGGSGGPPKGVTKKKGSHLKCEALELATIYLQ